MTGAARALAGLGAAAGCAGVALAAAAAHVTGGGSLETAARFLLAHAPALMALAALAATATIHPRLGYASGAVLAIGLVLFSGDLAWRGLLGWTPWHAAAPVGGTLLLAGWALAGLAALVPARTSP